MNKMREVGMGGGLPADLRAQRTAVSLPGTVEITKLEMTTWGVKAVSKEDLSSPAKGPRKGRSNNRKPF